MSSAAWRRWITRACSWFRPPWRCSALCCSPACSGPPPEVRAAHSRRRARSSGLIPARPAPDDTNHDPLERGRHRRAAEETKMRIAPPGTGLDRRAVFAAAAMFAAAPALARGAPFFRRHSLPIGLQLYTLGDISNSLDETLAKVAAIGFRTVELAGYYGRTPVELRHALDRAGLRCTSSHVRLTPGQDYARLAAEARIIGFD